VPILCSLISLPPPVWVRVALISRMADDGFEALVHPLRRDVVERLRDRLSGAETRLRSMRSRAVHR
jgi:hypothetical protein